MAANNGTIPNLPMDGPARADALQPARSSYLKTHDFVISKQDRGADVSAISGALRTDMEMVRQIK